MEVPKNWIDNLVDKCGASSVQQSFQDRSLIDIGMLGLVYGAFCGILSQQYFTPGLIASPPLNDTWWKIFLRFLMAVAIAAPWGIVTLGLAYSNLQNAYVLLVFKYFLPYFLMGNSLFFLADIVNMRIGLLELAPATPSKPGKEGDAEETEPILQPEQTVV